MKKVSTVCILALTFFAALAPGSASAQSEAGGIFLLISPGARAGGMGEAQVAVANDAYAGHWNPAGLAFLEGQELALMHVNWLPGLVDDIYYEFAAYRRHVPNIGTFGAQITYLSLGEQEQTNSDNPEVLGHFRSYMWNGALSYGYQWRENTSLGINLKIFHQFLAPASASDELRKTALPQHLLSTSGSWRKISGMANSLSVPPLPIWDQISPSSTMVRRILRLQLSGLA